MNPNQTSVLIPSLGRPHLLLKCLRGLAAQTRLPGEVIVVWQGDDIHTRDAAENCRSSLPYPLRVLYSQLVGIVPAENLALASAQGDIVLLIDDDAVAPQQWIERHLSYYQEASIGAAGGPIDNFGPDGFPSPPRRAVEPVGKLTWYGKPFGNEYNHVADWVHRPPIEVDHLMGSNFSFRRSALDQFESALRPYWWLFELDACLQIRTRGYRIVFDFANVVQHFSPRFEPPISRNNIPTVNDNFVYNYAFVLRKHTPLALRFPRLLFLVLIGATASPGLLASLVRMYRYGHPFQELTTLMRTWRSCLSGWRVGAKVRNLVQG